MLDLETIQSAQYDKNHERYQGSEHGSCRVCGRPITNPSKAYHVHEHNGGGYLVTEAEAATMDSGSDIGGQMIGANCYRKHRDVLAPYAKKASDWE